MTDYHTEYFFDIELAKRLEEVRTRLHSYEPLTGDDRRDLANKLDAIMHSARMIEETRNS